MPRGFDFSYSPLSVSLRNRPCSVRRCSCSSSGRPWHAASVWTGNRPLRLYCIRGTIDRMLSRLLTEPGLMGWSIANQTDCRVDPMQLQAIGHRVDSYG
jgi:hypothetical protein